MLELWTLRIRVIRRALRVAFAHDVDVMIDGRVSTDVAISDLIYFGSEAI